jgi:hypothetical protein
LTGTFNGEKDLPRRVTTEKPPLRRNHREARMHKIRVAIPAIVLGFAIGSTGTAWAAPEPAAGCSNGYELMRVNTVLRTIAAPGFEQSIKDFDVNGDGYLCIKIIPNEGGPPQFDPAFLYLDNKI